MKVMLKVHEGNRLHFVLPTEDQVFCAQPALVHKTVAQGSKADIARASRIWTPRWGHPNGSPSLYAGHCWGRGQQRGFLFTTNLGAGGD